MAIHRPPVDPPGPFLQKVNALIHEEPISTIVYGIFWSCLLLAVTPFAVLVLQLQAVAKLILWATGLDGRNAYNPKKLSSEKELCVLCTGCGTGFGREIALWAADAGFVVFAGCLSKESLAQYAEVDNVIALKMDVTSDNEVNEALQAVSKWLNEPSGKKRVLHSLINNAGVAAGGETDWLEFSAYQKIMDVNFFGIVRCCKAFLPIFQEQAVSKTHTGARIINIISMAGKIAIPGFNCYAASKHAAVAFTSALRGELKPFGIQVSAVNPSFHGTPLVSTMNEIVMKEWNSLSKEKQTMYGEEFLERYLELAVDAAHGTTWKMQVVVDQVVGLLEARRLPGEVQIGTDARFGLTPLMMLPPWLRELIMGIAQPRPIPSAMK